ncbi:sodium:proton antiporter NhaD [Luteibaculum oceani]|uniref:Sodium:proton antiporter n=1 Tax=Luteibaculum oceani TaxID=1294296 RepID=A0A5C6UZC0_9FLAO|nr:sodium:proton antiporter NhaD [Luteibaculum oceani]TXC78783.1 sodium:proton antiporter [Luteibaculum oceani]
METFILLVFIIGYLLITLEHTIKIDKLIPALGMMALAWAGVALGLDDFTQWFDSANYSMLDGFVGMEHKEKLHVMEETLLHHFGKTCEILIFLMGAMTIVEIIDHFDGFVAIKDFIKTNKKRTLLWIIAFLAFILSAIIDNLTATIVLITLLRKILHSNKDRLWFAGLIVVAANAGGAWSPIGDVTTTMLWIGEKVSTGKLVTELLLPSLVCMLVPTFIASFLTPFKGEFSSEGEIGKKTKVGSRILYLGLGMIVFVPIFKTVTHLPPYIGMMLSLTVVSLVAEIISNRKFSLTDFQDDLAGGGHGAHSPTMRALSRIEMPSILFFLGILMTVAALESLGMIFTFGGQVREVIPDNLFVILLGAGSAVIDNVPLVAASMGMFDMPTDAGIWHFIAYAAGTGGSMLIIGSAAGVVAMGMENISFGWYLKKISGLALAGYLAGAAVYLLL